MESIHTQCTDVVILFLKDVPSEYCLFSNKEDGCHNNNNNNNSNNNNNNNTFVTVHDEPSVKSHIAISCYISKSNNNPIHTSNNHIRMCFANKTELKKGPTLLNMVQKS